MHLMTNNKVRSQISHHVYQSVASRLETFGHWDISFFSGSVLKLILFSWEYRQFGNGLKHLGLKKSRSQKSLILGHVQTMSIHIENSKTQSRLSPPWTFKDWSMTTLSYLWIHIDLDLFFREENIQEPCYSCGRTDQPERFHTHPGIPYILETIPLDPLKE